MSAAVNQPAPDFVLPGADGTPLQLSALRGRKVVLFFYPRDDSPVCTVQACAFRDAYEELTTAGAEVVGVSSDSAESHRRFAAKRELPFPIVSDPDGSVRRLYGASSSRLLGKTGRVTYLIDEEGVVRDVFSSMFRAFEHVRRARAWVSGQG
jgi:peroxiredoxin Q/BCP